MLPLEILFLEPSLQSRSYHPYHTHPPSTVYLPEQESKFRIHIRPPPQHLPHLKSGPCVLLGWRAAPGSKPTKAKRPPRNRRAAQEKEIYAISPALGVWVESYYGSLCWTMLSTPGASVCMDLRPADRTCRLTESIGSGVPSSPHLFVLLSHWPHNHTSSENLNLLSLAFPEASS